MNFAVTQQNITIYLPVVVETRSREKRCCNNKDNQRLVRPQREIDAFMSYYSWVPSRGSCCSMISGYLSTTLFGRRSKCLKLVDATRSISREANVDALVLCDYKATIRFWSKEVVRIARYRQPQPNMWLMHGGLDR